MASRFLSAKGLMPGNCPVATPEVADCSLSLLIIEDVQEDVELITFSLDEAKIAFHWEVANTLEQCRFLLTQQDFHVVLADYRLPGLQAPQVYELVNELQPNTPFILVTGSLGEEAAVECIKNGMTDYVLKDRLYRLPTVLKRALDEAQLKREQQAAIAQIEQQAWRESVLNRIVQAMRETLILEEVLQTTVDQLQAELRVDRCLIVQPGIDDQMVIQYISSDSSQGNDFLNRLCQICAHFSREISDGMQIIVGATEDKSLPPLVSNFLHSFQLRSVLVTPLQYQHETLGAIVLHQVCAEREWTDTEVSLIEVVAEQCAIAIYQANLYAQAQRELEQRRRVEEQLRHDAFHDGLTGLPNRALFLDRLNHALQIAHRRQDNDTTTNNTRHFAVLFLDLDDFRIVNDSLGHDAGDYLLQVVADRLTRCLRVGDTLARTSGDEFAILLEDIIGIDDILNVVDHIQATLRHPITLESQEIFISSCIGIVMDGANYSDPSQFLRDADTAMYQAKSKGRGSYQVFNLSMHTEVKQRLKIENDLRRALDRDEFSLTYQPIIHLPTRQFRGFEALIRWVDPHQGLLYPNRFIPVAEQTGLIVPIGEWVMWEACRQWKRWLNRWPAAMASCTISVNLSAKQFIQQDLITQIERILQETGVDSHFLRVEITESALLENEATSLETLKQLKNRGIQVAMDDFGTGYSSLSYLLRFPKDVLKIDKSFVSNLDNNPDNQEIIKTILSLGCNLGLEVVAEGIETQHQAQFLLNHGCVFGQGYWFAKPLTHRNAEAMLKQEFEAQMTF
jgi:diguanylate cyclase (GGDEF)-like protein